MYARPTSSTPKGGLTLTENKRYVTPLRNEVDVRSKQQNLVTDNSFEKEFSIRQLCLTQNPRQIHLGSHHSLYNY